MALFTRVTLCSRGMAYIGGSRFIHAGQRFCCESASKSEGNTVENSEKEVIGFIGLGNMGAHMATNLIKKGHKLVVNDIYPEAMVQLKSIGAEMVLSPAEVSAKAKKIITMLPSSPEVKDVYAGPEGLLRTASEGTIMIDSSTIDPIASKEISALAETKGCYYLDAPVSGGVVAARDATLTFMVGGRPDIYTIAEELLQHIGKNVIHCGAVGTGQAAKICNNMLLAISMIGTSETMNLGTRLGLDKKLLAKILNMSTGRCWSSEVYNPCPGVIDGIPSSNDYQGGFGTQLMVKDLGLAQNAATATKSATPMGSLAHQMYRIMCNGGYAKLDFSSVFRFLREDN